MRETIRVVSASSGPPASATFEMTVTAPFCSRRNNMHGGAVSLVFDMCTTMAAAPAASKGWWEFGGVSRGLSMTFLRPIAKGTEVLVECEVLQMGKRMGKSVPRSAPR